MFATLFVAACGGRSESITEVAADAATLPCQPGEQIACACMEGTKGYQICKAGGQAFYPCECPEVTNDAGKDAVTNDAPDAKADSTPDTQAEADAQADADAGSDADADALAVETGVDAEAGADAAEAETSVDAEAGFDAGTDADAEAGTKIILTVAKAATAVPADYVAGMDHAKPHAIQFCVSKQVEIQRIEIYLQTNSPTAKTEGSLGTRYFRNLRLRDGATTAMGPVELKTEANEIMPQRAKFADTINLAPATCKILDVNLDIWNVEDATDELYNQLYQIQVIGVGAIVKAGGDEPMDRPMNSDEIQWNDPNSLVFKILPLQPVLEVKTSSDTPASDIIVAGKNVLYPFSKQDVCNLTDNPVTFAYPYIQQACEGAGGDFTLIDSTFEGSTAHLGSSAFDMFQLAFGMGSSGETVTIPAKTCLKATLTGKTQPVMPTSAAPGDNTVSRSGHAPCLRLVKFADSGGVQIPTKYTPTDKPNPMVLRKAKPIETVQNPITPVLYNAEMALHCWTTAVDAASPTDCMAYKQEMLTIETSGMNGVQICNFKLYRGSTAIPPAAYNVTDAVQGSDLKASCKPTNQTHATVAVSLAEEDYVCGSGYLYCLRAVTLTTTPGNTVTTKFLTNSGVNRTGQLLNNDWEAPYLAHPNIFNVGGPADPQTQLGAWHVLGDMVWSDQSEVPHSSSVLGSKDWINSSLIQDRNKATVLSN